MKEIQQYNPWPAVRWMAAGMIYLATVGIAWDQLNNIKDEKQKISKDLQLLRGDSTKMKTALKKAQEGEKEWQDRFIDLAAKGKTAMDASGVLVDALNRKISLLETKAALLEAGRPNIAAAAATTTSAKVNIPRWMPDSPIVVARKIKDRATREHGNDFSSAKYEIEWQIEAHEKLVRYHRMNNPTVNDVLSKAAFEKGDDYRAMVWEVERQLEAAQKIQSSN
jgi:hypothetical protein